ncbi:hypothetical protein G7Z17_g6668 [Cylindrodendrum hubeiense]|uniref:Exo-alpha-sialidase / neuraminidase n=1 Tax=Cylindrodendrum hubeiense TaxID=595255 RepID=A0A9P5HER3_9HYPO|nr:hypothetical protein G7Z17_g6668 [Cylindrodendrum hubeiense]
MASSSISLVLLLACLLGTVLALQVTPGSSCATFCLDHVSGNAYDPKASTTNTSDIICKDSDFSDEAVGIKFQNCLECLQKSEKTNGTESDLHWYLYNLRYTISTCLFSIPNAPSFDVDSPCVIDYGCQPLKESVTFDKLASKSNETYGYCDADDGEFMGSKLKGCISCLQSSGNQVYLSNFVIALEAGCEQKPDAGDRLSLSGSIFSRTAVNITTAGENILDKPEGAGSGSMTTGTIVGIAVGTALFFFSAVALFIVYWRKQRKAKRDEKASYHGSNTATPDPFLPPDARGMSASLRSYSAQSYYDKGGRMTSGDYYDRLEQERSGSRLNYNFDPRSSSRGPNTALPTHQAYKPTTMSRVAIAESSPTIPLPVHERSGSKTANSYALQTYINTNDDSAAAAAAAAAVAVHPPPPPYTGGPSNSASIAVPPPPPGPPPSKHSKVPSLSMPSVPRIRVPKKYTPPTVVISGATPTDEHAPIMNISPPVMVDDMRFQDTPHASDASYAEYAPERAGQDVGDVPLKSGKSTLYGF